MDEAEDTRVLITGAEHVIHSQLQESCVHRGKHWAPYSCSDLPSHLNFRLLPVVGHGVAHGAVRKEQ